MSQIQYTEEYPVLRATIEGSWHQDKYHDDPRFFICFSMKFFEMSEEELKGLLIHTRGLLDFSGSSLIFVLLLSIIK